MGRQRLDDLQQQGQAGPPVRTLLHRHAPLRVRRQDRRQLRSALRPGRTGRRDPASRPHLGQGRLRRLAAGELGRQRHGPDRRPQSRRRRRRLLRAPARRPTTCRPGTRCVPTRPTPPHSQARYPDPIDRAKQTQAADKTRVHAATPTVAHTDPWAALSSRSCPTRTSTATRRRRIHRSTRSTPRRSSSTSKATSARSSTPRTASPCATTYDMLGNPVHQANMEAGERWMLNDVAGHALYAWDSRDRRVRTAYDPLRRPTDSLLSEAGGPELVVGRTVYGEETPEPGGRQPARQGRRGLRPGGRRHERQLRFQRQSGSEPSPPGGRLQHGAGLVRGSAAGVADVFRSHPLRRPEPCGAVGRPAQRSAGHGDQRRSAPLQRSQPLGAGGRLARSGC